MLLAPPAAQQKVAPIAALGNDVACCCCCCIAVAVWNWVWIWVWVWIF